MCWKDFGIYRNYLLPSNFSLHLDSDQDVYVLRGPGQPVLFCKLFRFRLKHSERQVGMFTLGGKGWRIWALSLKFNFVENAMLPLQTGLR